MSIGTLLPYWDRTSTFPITLRPDGGSLYGLRLPNPRRSQIFVRRTGDIFVSVYTVYTTSVSIRSYPSPSTPWSPFGSGPTRRRRKTTFTDFSVYRVVQRPT